ncbi:hypothetical protein SAMN04488096_106260 [Mesonia phycicola]|uniref:DUF4174 domain-containing protein n=1 Tax=Mesonia phycicola TaxID=579105 RepID=A0A1M6FQ10_9FLAO|nr:hypothetical protein [Mesonia phycicola]SHI99848.1 hypothetical protein SAMN04488096_106260 [Mesonia phycicola]
MKYILLFFTIITTGTLQAQVPLQETSSEKEINSGYIVLVTSSYNLPKAKEQYDIFENGRKFFAERNIQPYVVTPDKVESFFNEKNERLLNFGDYQKLQQANTDFLVIVLDEDFHVKYKTKNPITPLEISEVME